MLTLSEHLNSPWFLQGSCYSCFSFQCSVVCSLFVFRFMLLAMVLSVFRLNDFCLPLWYLQISVLKMSWNWDFEHNCTASLFNFPFKLRRSFKQLRWPLSHVWSFVFIFYSKPQSMNLCHKDRHKWNLKLSILAF